MAHPRNRFRPRVRALNSSPNGRRSPPAPAAAMKRPRRRWPACCVRISSPPKRVTCPPSCSASRTISTRASRTCASRSVIVGGFHDELARAPLPRRAPADEDPPARLRGAPGAEADVRGGHPRCRSVARDAGRRVRASRYAPQATSRGGATLPERDPPLCIVVSIIQRRSDLTSFGAAGSRSSKVSWQPNRLAYGVRPGVEQAKRW